MNKNIVKNALETNAFAATATAAGYINPEVWARYIEEFAHANLVVAPLGKVRNDLLNKPGDILNISLAAEITAAALTESTALSTSAIVYTQLQITPSERGIGISVTRKEMVRAFLDVMKDKAQDMGYALAKLKDQSIIANLVTYAGLSVVADSVAATALASSNTLDTDDIANAIGQFRNADEKPEYLILHPLCEKDLLKNSNFIDASKYGGREVVLNGEIGKYLGLKVFVTSLISPLTTPTGSTCRYNLMLAKDAFIVAPKMGVTFDSFYKILEREFVLTAVEDYGYSYTRANKICTISAYAG